MATETFIRAPWTDVVVSNRTVPHIPGLSNPASLVRLHNYTFFPARVPATLAKKPSIDERLGLNASAELINPLHNVKALKDLAFEWDMPWRIPFAISLPTPAPRKNRTSPATARDGDDVLMAHVDMLPFHLSMDTKKIPLSLTGALIRAEEGGDKLRAALGDFLGRFLKGQSSPVRIRYDAAYTAGPTSSLPAPPPFIGRLLSDFGAVTVPFPAPPSGQLLKNVTIEGMRVRPEGGEVLCSGTVKGVLELPEEMKALQSLLDITQIQPDVLVYDGDLPKPKAEGEEYPPDPLPRNAFGRLKTDHLIPATTVLDPTHNRTLLEAKLVDVPIELLPGRGDAFRRYVGKILFGGGGDKGVETSVAGLSDVVASVQGFGEVTLDHLPIQGTFYVGGGSAMRAAWDGMVEDWQK